MSNREFAQPNRPLSTNFTDDTLRRAISAKRQSVDSGAQEENFRMKTYKLMTRPVGAVLALAVILTGGLTTYAAANWFGSNVGIVSDDSVVTVDLSNCQGTTLPPGIEQTVDPAKVQFKITGTPHIGEAALQQRLLAECEWQTIQTINADKTDSSASVIGVVKDSNASTKTITATITFGGSTFDKTFTLEPSVQIYDKGSVAAFSSLTPGREMVLMYDLSSPAMEGGNPFNRDISLKGIFVPQYDLRDVIAKEKPLYGQPNNIMPLEPVQRVAW